MASVPGAAVATMARAAGPQAPAGDGGVPARDPLQPLLRPGGGGHRRGDGDHCAHQGGQGWHQRVPGERGPQGQDSVVRQPAAVSVNLPPLR